MSQAWSWRPRVAAVFAILFASSIAAADSTPPITSNTVTSPTGNSFAPMRVKAAEDRAAAAVRAEQRRFEAAKAAKQAPAAQPKKASGAPAGGGGASPVGRAASALLDLALAQVGTPDLFATPNWALSKLPTAHCSIATTVECQKDSDCPGYLPPTAVSFYIVPSGETCTGPVKPGTGIQKFVNTLPGLCALGKNDLGQCLPLAVPDTTTYPGSDYYELGLTQFQAQFHRDLPATTRLRGYYQKNVAAGNEAGVGHYLGPIILATTNKPVRVHFTNELGTGAAGDLFIPVDTTTLGAGLGPDGVHSYTQNRAAIHLHGGNTPWISDGTQHQWTVPSGEDTPYKKGWTVGYVPDMWYDAAHGHAPIPSCSKQLTCNAPGTTPTNDPGDGKLTFYWSNQQSGRMMFYHDHAYGITRLNVLAGEAAGYVLVNPPDEDALAAATVPGTLGSSLDLAHYVPLVIQDRTFVPPPAQLAAQDPTWDTARWGQEGDLWYPHVYTPNQWPQNPDNSSANPFGRWDYGPWFWPPQTVLTEVKTDGTIANRPLTQPCTTSFNGSPLVTECPTIPNPSAVPESFLDTPVVNGTAYPTTTVDPVAYRFQILNAANERNLNLSFFVADASGTEVKMVPAVPHVAPGSTPALCTVGAAASPVTGLPPGCWPRTWPIDARMEGVPDPLTAGPLITQIGNETGLLAKAATIPAQAVNYEYNRRNIVVLNVSDKALFLGPAERADVVVDFSAFAGQTLILYNDAPAPVPAGDPRTDYFTGAFDQTSAGGAPSPLPGYGPNTRTIMQIKVRAAPTGATPPGFDPVLASAAVAARFKASQPPPIVPEAAYNDTYTPATAFTNHYSNISDTQMTFTPVCTQTGVGCSGAQFTIDATGQTTIPFGSKAIQELFDADYGRMNATLGAERMLTNFLNQTTIPFGNIDPATEFLSNQQPQIWKITHNGVDTHTIHFHLLNLQVLNRVGWDGQIRPPDANEIGWKESIRMHPLEDVVVALLPVRQDLPWPLPDLIRPLDVTRPLGTAAQFTGVDVNNAPIAVTNVMTNFGWEYVWHCHLLGHEEADMLRAEVMIVPPEDPSGFSVVLVGGDARLTWTDNSKSAQTFVIERATDPSFSPTSLNYRTWTVPAPATQPGAAAATDAAIPSGSFVYRVKGAKAFSSPAVPGSSYTSSSGWSNVATLVMTPIASVSPASLTFGNVSWPVSSTAQTVTIANDALATLPLTIAGIAISGANAADFAQTNTCAGSLAIGGNCTISVTFTPIGSGARSASLTFATNDPVNPTYTVALSGTGVVPPVTGLNLTTSLPTPQPRHTAITLTAAPTGPAGLPFSSIQFSFQQWTQATNTWEDVAGCSWAWGASTCAIPTTTAGGYYAYRALARTSTGVSFDVMSAALGFTFSIPKAAGVSLSFSPTSPRPQHTPVTMTATPSGPASLLPSEYQIAFQQYTQATGTWADVAGCGWTWGGTTCALPTSLLAGTYYLRALVRTTIAVNWDVVSANLPFTFTVPKATGVGIAASPASPQLQGTAVTLTATPAGPSTILPSEYQISFQQWTQATNTWVDVAGCSWAWGGTTCAVPTSTPAGYYAYRALVRTTTAVSSDAISSAIGYTFTFPKATSVSISASPASPQPFATPLTLTAIPSGPPSVLPSGFQVRFQQWTQATNAWVDISGCGWAWGVTTCSVPTSTPAGYYAFRAQARTSTSVTYDVISTAIGFTFN